MAKFKYNEAVLLKNKHGRIVDIQAQMVCTKLGSGRFDWPDFEAMPASEVQKHAVFVGVKYEGKEKAIKAMEARAIAIAKQFMPDEEVLMHPNNELMRVSLDRLGIIDY